MACFPKMALASSPDLHVCLDPGNSSIKRWSLNPLSLNLGGFMTHFDAVWLLRQLLPYLLELLPWSLGLPCKCSICIETTMLWGSPTSSDGHHSETRNYLERGAQTDSRCSSSPAVSTSATLWLYPRDKDRPWARAAQPACPGLLIHRNLKRLKKKNDCHVWSY